MRAHLLISFAALLGPSVALPSAVAQTTAILRPGLSLGPRPDVPANQSWLGLYKTPAGYALRPTTIAIADTSDPCAGAALMITASGSDTPEYLLLTAALKPGPVRTSTSTATFLYPGQNVTWQVNPGEYFWVVAYGKAERIPGNTLFTKYELIVGRGQYGDTLDFPSSFPSDGQPTIRWAGDLDRDGRPDLIADLTTHYEGHRWALFLSRGLGSQRRLLPEAVRIEPGC